VTRQRDGRPGFHSEQGHGVSLFTTASRPAVEATQPPIQWVLESLLPGVKRPERETDHLSQSSTDLKDVWSYTSASPYIFMA
jgi:hypothetical protein